MGDKALAKDYVDLLVSAKSIGQRLIDKGIIDAQDVRLTIAARKEAAVKLVESGVSQRRVAKMLGVDQSTVRADLGLRDNPSKSEGKSLTGSAKTKAKRAAVAENASSKGVTPAPTDKYRIIYADPPWDYGAHAQPDYQTEQRDHYAVMSVEAICAEPVRDWIEKDAVLFLWVTSPILEKSFAVIHAWGFEYKASFIWDKIKHNMGHYNSVRHELLLVCTRGACQPDNQQLFDSVQSIERGRHSEKPVEFFDIIETLYTHGRRLQMYGRSKRDGWDTYGHIAELEAAE
jgi:N6-adenosine-specific RNA methylase IME4